jgi:tetratricopeptide (TPR) repeat protein
VTEAKADLAFLLAKQTDVDDETLGRALTLAREAVAAMPDDAQSLDILGLVYLRQGDAATALGQFRQALEQPGAARPDIHYHAGMALRALDRNREAVQAFERALEIDSNFHQAADARRQLEIARKAAGVQTESG